jgi:ATP-binding protein involved in chromosome partitioning
MFWDKKPAQRLSEATIRDALGDPEWLLGVRLGGEGKVTAVISADPKNKELSETRRIETETRLRNLRGVRDVNVALTAERAPKSPAASPPERTRLRKGARLSDQALRQGAPEAQNSLEPIPGISRILAVSSAKGGVGKSTLSVNLAASFARQGLRVGLLDADIYGPSIPIMLGTENASPTSNADGKLEPVAAHGIQSLSIGYLADTDAPMIWRGPIVQSAITQMLKDTAWGAATDPLDLLIIDMPPGTGEAQLTLAQKVPVTAALLVTTPQDVALADVRRGAAMFTRTNVPVLGVVETMSWFDDPSGQRHFLLGKDGGARVAGALGLPLLGQLPLLPAIREGGDAGQPAALVDDVASSLFSRLARDVALALDALQTKPPPQIIFTD